MSRSTMLALGGVRHAAQTQAERGRAQVHRAARGHAGVFGMLHDGNIELGGSAQRVAHQTIV